MPPETGSTLLTTPLASPRGRAPFSPGDAGDDGLDLLGTKYKYFDCSTLPFPPPTLALIMSVVEGLDQYQMQSIHTNAAIS